MDAATIAEAVRAVAPACDAVAIVCTNLNGASLAADLEREVGRPACDSIAVTIWRSLRLAGCDARRLGRWGELLRAGVLNPASPAVPRSPRAKP